MICSRCQYANWNWQSPRNAGHCSHPEAVLIIKLPRLRPRLPVWNSAPTWCPLRKKKDVPSDK